MGQAELGKLNGVSDRVVGYHEANVRFSNKPETLREISKVFNVSVDFLLGIEGTFDQSSVVKFDNTGWGQAKEILNDVQKIFAIEQVLEEDKDEFLRLIAEMYFEAKKNHKLSSLRVPIDKNEKDVSFPTLAFCNFAQ